MVGMSRKPEPTTARKPLASYPSRENSKNLSTGDTASVASIRMILFYAIQF